MEASIDIISLRKAWNALKSSPGAETPGIDGLSWSSFAKESNARLKTIARGIRNGQYQPLPLLKLRKPKPGKPGKYRTLSIPSIVDRLVALAIKQTLEPQCELNFHAYSFGFRPGRSVASAIQAVISKLNSAAKNSQCLDFGMHLDIVDCFDSIPHSLIWSEMKKFKLSHAASVVIRQLVNAHATSTKPHPKGLPQGCPLSPLLCNLALTPVDHEIEQAKRNYGNFEYFRYADDLLILAHMRHNVLRAKAFVANCLQRRNLKLVLQRHLGDEAACTRQYGWQGEAGLLPVTSPVFAGSPDCDCQSCKTSQWRCSTKRFVGPATSDSWH